jgi:hypothetical protein
MSEKTSAYVFPFKPFASLSETKETSTFLPGRTVEADYFAPMIEAVAPKLQLPATGSLPERLLQFFADPAVCFGDPDWILQLGAHWKEQFAYFIERNEPIGFTILGFPFKAPVPLKTNRKLPDFGEVAMLARLHQIGAAIADAYEPGAMIHVFAEGSFHEMNGMPRADADAYFVALEETAARFGYDRYVKLHDTSRIADEVDGFHALWDEVTKDIKARRDSGDATTVDALTAAYPVTFHLNDVTAESPEAIRLAYLNDPAGAALRQKLDARSAEGVVRYRAFLEARDRIQLLERYAPKAVALTVSPRPGRIGVRPLPLPADVLPYHGVPVWNRKEGTLSIIYIWDLRRQGLEVSPIHLNEDSDGTPYLYEV